MELSEERRSFSDLVVREVRDQSGRRLGRVYEARGHREPDGAIVIDELLIGVRGLRRRLRGPATGAGAIPWDAVVEVGPERIVVRA